MPTCPSCALYHPARYDACISCGTRLVADGASIVEPGENYPDVSGPVGGGGKPPRGGKTGRSLPVTIGITIGGLILCGSAGFTYFYLSRPPESERMFQQGQSQLANGQYAFALQTLNQAVAQDPKNAKALLALARAYVGVDQVDKAWDAIMQAQALGTGVIAEPQLASDLANYYRQRNQYQRAVELLRPLAQADIPRKKAELADLDALWGDECLRSGDLKQAMRCWEEVREVHEGSRFAEAESRLATIYQKVANDMVTKGDTEEALKYYTKLNVFAPSSHAFERTAELYEKQGKLDLAVDQMRRAVKLSNDTYLTKKLAWLLSKYGKDLLDKGESDAGYGYLQQAQTLDPRTKAPPVTVRNVQVTVDPLSGRVQLVGEVWNPGPSDISYLSVKGDLFDTKASKVLWQHEQHVIDEFVPPLPSRESRSFQLISQVPARVDGSNDFRVYLNGTLYKTYAVGHKSGNDTTASTSSPTVSEPFVPASASLRPRIPVAAPTSTTPVTSPVIPQPAPTTHIPPTFAPTPGGGLSPEEKTLKDLD